PHRVRVRMLQEYRRLGEQVWMSLDDGSSPIHPIHFTPECGEVGHRAVAVAVEIFRVDHSLLVHVAAFRSAKSRKRNKPAIAPASCAPMNIGASSGRIPAKVSLRLRPMVIA